MSKCDAAVLARVWRGDMVESVHRGHAVVVRPDGKIVAQWGDATKEIYPRSSCKMIQALPLLESGAAEACGLDERHLALACASHNGAAIHTDLVSAWLADLGLVDGDLRCGAQPPNDKQAKHALIASGSEPCQVHNNCSGKHAGFLTLARHFGAGPEYVEPDHAVQVAVQAAFEDMTETSTGRFGIDGCSAPNFSTTLHGLALAAAKMATTRDGTRGRAALRLVAAMRLHPELVAGEGRACTGLMRAMSDGVVKTGAEGVFLGILPQRGLGIALKIEDGATRASEAAMAALLVGAGVLAENHPTAKSLAQKALSNWAGRDVGRIMADQSLMTAY